MRQSFLFFLTEPETVRPIPQQDYVALAREERRIVVSFRRPGIHVPVEAKFAYCHRGAQGRDVDVAMLTGDNRATAERVGKEVGMVGDGINDAPALTQADMGFPIGAGTDVAMESADVLLMKSDPSDVVAVAGLSRVTLRKMHQNLWWAVGYNVIAFPFAAGVFYLLTISPEMAAIAMSGSSLLVAVNALLFKRAHVEGLK